MPTSNRLSAGLSQYSRYVLLVLLAMGIIYYFGWEEDGHIKLFFRKVLKSLR
jgi:hypothetical protein